MKPHLWFSRGNWHCAIPHICAGVTVLWWPRGIGDTQEEAYRNFEQRAQEWRVG